jgi:hypothetical protein
MFDIRCLFIYAADRFECANIKKMVIFCVQLCILAQQNHDYTEHIKKK